MNALTEDRIDTFRADMMARYVQAGGENGEAFEAPCRHAAHIYELTTPTVDADHASYTGMCKECHALLGVVEWKTDRPNELRVLAGGERALAQKAWMARLNSEMD